ncbi:MAG TPA: transketolase C-terminal domain-containing protein [Planctomycetota bacterium]|nr:transketolase C-terminal domain-containing protein [Planctomycetota bacterium]HRR79948.1 transketolase C-terminal domain-containing protein [Planctomycetota bacterium]HRT95371.1 transketolase C-terminal domain-containing protein [Planctomycetota bacterium]
MPTPAKEATRDAFGRALVRLGERDARVVVLDADLFRSTRTNLFAEKFPNRFFEMGIAEQDMVSTAAGLAMAGKIAFANSFAVFITGRAFDQVRQQVALPALNVRLCGSSAGLTLGADGATHQSVVDVALMRSLPNMTVIVPCDGPETERAVEASLSHPGPIYLRLSRYDTPAWTAGVTDFAIGKASCLREGCDITIAATGVIMGEVLAAAERLVAKGVSAEVLDVHTVKPLDADAILASAAKTGRLLTVEEHSIIGGLGSAVCELIAERADRHIPVRRLGIRDTFGESGSADELLELHRLTAPHIAREAEAVIGVGGEVLGVRRRASGTFLLPPAPTT